MSTQVQYRRGTAAQHATFVGAPGEITVDTTNNTLRVHDGITPGGHPLTLQSLFNAHLAETVQEGVHGLIVQTGTWTPRYIGETTAGTMTDIVKNVGFYTRVGNTVFLYAASNLKLNGASGLLNVTDLPFIASTNTTYSEGGRLVYSNIGDLAVINPAVRNRFRFRVVGGADFNVTSLQNGQIDISFNMTYRI